MESYCYYYCTARIRERMIESIGESRPDYEIITELADRLGYGELCPRHSEDVLARFLTNTGFTVQEWREDDDDLEAFSSVVETSIRMRLPAAHIVRRPMSRPSIR